MAAKHRDQLTRLSQTWKHFEYWWYRQKLSLNWAFFLEKKIFKHYFTAFIGFSQKSRWLPYRALVQNAFRKHASALPNDDLSEISAHMGCWFWRRRFLNIILQHLLVFRKKQDGRHTAPPFKMPFANLKVLWLMMIWVKFQFKWSTGSGEDDIYRLKWNFSKSNMAAKVTWPHAILLSNFTGQGTCFPHTKFQINVWTYVDHGG